MESPEILSDTQKKFRLPLVAGFLHVLEQLGGQVLYGLEQLGHVTLFAASTFAWLFRRWPAKGTIWPTFYQVGVRSVPVVALTGTFVGMVLAVQSYTQFHRVGMETWLGAVINMAVIRELGPVLAAVMLAGRVGSAMAAELGTMRVTEQIDALTAMGTNPIHYLVVPRFLACLLMIPALSVVADFMGVLGGYFYSVWILGIDPHHYVQNSADYIKAFDVLAGVAKTFFFGAAIALIACYQGFHCAPGAEGVGRAATAAFVVAFVVILMLDLALGIIIEKIYLSIWPEGPKLL
ncbi:MAG: ABC transporter permease [Thermoguttaceae bacterium]|nr:ABC transporter permease [Thermoguttaceae bacterium]MDW8078181.1 ABC transporter permease [Thermoguttaceae bacterium]